MVYQTHQECTVLAVGLVDATVPSILSIVVLSVKNSICLMTKFVFVKHIKRP